MSLVPACAVTVNGVEICIELAGEIISFKSEEKKKKEKRKNTLLQIHVE